MLRGEDIVLQTEGLAVRTYTYVADAIGAMLLAFTKGKDSYYNIANLDNLISIRDLPAPARSGFPVHVPTACPPDGW